MRLLLVLLMLVLECVLVGRMQRLLKGRLLLLLLLLLMLRLLLLLLWRLHVLR